MIDRIQIEKFCTTIYESGDIFEVRALPKKDSGGCVQAGWFDLSNLPVLFRKLEKLGDDVEGVYATIQHLKKDVGGRTPIGHFGPVVGSRGVTFPRLTHDTDIGAYRWVVVDVDPVRAAGQSATDEEKRHAARVICSAIARLYKPTIIVDSGNGYHAYWRIMDSPEVEVNATKTHELLNLIDSDLSDDYAEIDTRTYNPSRIMKLPGTMARKGPGNDGRPFRMAKIVEIDDIAK